MIPFLTIINISTSISKSSSTFVFREPDQVHIILWIYLQSFQIHLLVAVYHSIRKDHDVDIDSIF